MLGAIAAAISEAGDYADFVRRIGRRYPLAGYGARFHDWLLNEHTEPYDSWGNGSAMRVSAVGFAFDDLDTVLAEARKSAEFTHNHAEGIKGAQATALAILLARHGEGKDSIREQITDRFGYDLDRTIDAIRPGYEFNESCQGTVPEAIRSFEYLSKLI